jgi:hypothetical protein
MWPNIGAFFAGALIALAVLQLGPPVRFLLWAASC